MKTFQYSLLILEQHLDSFGHMNNATYLTLFEEARWDLITNNGYGYREIQANQKGPVILGVTLKFLNELVLRDEVMIESCVPSYEKRIGKIAQKMIHKASGKVACEAEFTFAFFDLKERKIIKPIPEWRTAIGVDAE